MQEQSVQQQNHPAGSNEAFSQSVRADGAQSNEKEQWATPVLQTIDNTLDTEGTSIPTVADGISFGS